MLYPSPDWAGEKEIKIKQFEDESKKVEQLFKIVSAKGFKGTATATYLLVNSKKEIRMEVQLFLEQKREKRGRYIHIHWEILLPANFKQPEVLKITNDLNNKDFFANITVDNDKVKDNYGVLFQQVAPQGKVDTKLMTLYVDRAARSYAKTKKRLQDGGIIK
jgi:hypothetical protein